MSDPKTVSEREAVERVRSAVRHALYHGAGWGAAVADAYVNREHPRPKVERPRVVKFPEHGLEYRYADGQLEYRGMDSDALWSRSVSDASQIRALADLLTNPTEWIEDS